MEFSRPEYWSGQVFPFPGDLPNPAIEPRSPTLQVDSLPAEPQGKPKNTGVGSPSLLQGIFPTQELNRGLLHCRWIPYQLSHQGSPESLEGISQNRGCGGLNRPHMPCCSSPQEMDLRPHFKSALAFGLILTSCPQGKQHLRLLSEVSRTSWLLLLPPDTPNQTHHEPISLTEQESLQGQRSPVNTQH